MTVTMTVTADQIESLAKELHLEKSKAEQIFHGQSIVPWDALGESYKVSLLRMAEDQLENPK